jgi:hypothetical protein
MYNENLQERSEFALVNFWNEKKGGCIKSIDFVATNKESLEKNIKFGTWKTMGIEKFCMKYVQTVTNTTTDRNSEITSENFQGKNL